MNFTEILDALLWDNKISAKKSFKDFFRQEYGVVYKDYRHLNETNTGVMQDTEVPDPVTLKNRTSNSVNTMFLRGALAYMIENGVLFEEHHSKAFKNAVRAARDCAPYIAKATSTYEEEEEEYDDDEDDYEDDDEYGVEEDEDDEEPANLTTGVNTAVAPLLPATPVVEAAQEANTDVAETVANTATAPAGVEYITRQ